MAQLIVGLTPALARALARGERTRDTTRLRDITAQARVELRPQTVRALDSLDTEPGDASDTEPGDTPATPAEPSPRCGSSSRRTTPTTRTTSTRSCSGSPE